MAHAMLGGVTFSTDPESIRWNFKIKAARQRTIGGQVIQILGVHISDMTVVGRFGADTKVEPWQEYNAFRKRIKGWVEDLQKDTALTPLRFVYPPRNWDFGVYVKAFAPIQHSNENIAPQFTLTLFISDGTNTIAKGIKDLYMKRLMDGIGWKQTAYNGPSQQEVDDLLGPFHGSAGEFLASEAQAAFDAGLQGQFGAANN